MYVRKFSAKGVKVPMRAMSSAQQNAMIQQVTEQQTERAARVVPWFLKNMPVSQFIHHFTT